VNSAISAWRGFGAGFFVKKNILSDHELDIASAKPARVAGVRFDVKRKPLADIKALDAGSLRFADVNEYIVAAIIALDKSEAAFWEGVVDNSLKH
jgi:hypothetical protein